jgi:tryptophan halogenase
MELFRDNNWFAILHGQGLEPSDYHPVADAMPADLLRDRLAQARAAIERRVAALPLHDDMLAGIARQS